MEDIRCLVGKLVGAYEDILHTKTKPTTTMASDAAQVENGEPVGPISQPEMFKNPFRELFLWAVLMNRFDMALYMWEKVEEEAVPHALVACQIFRAMQLMQDKLEGDVSREPTVLEHHAK